MATSQESRREKYSGNALIISLTSFPEKKTRLVSYIMLRKCEKKIDHVVHGQIFDLILNIKTDLILLEKTFNSTIQANRSFSKMQHRDVNDFNVGRVRK